MKQAAYFFILMLNNVNNCKDFTLYFIITFQRLSSTPIVKCNYSKAILIKGSAKRCTVWRERPCGSIAEKNKPEQNKNRTELSGDHQSLPHINNPTVS